MSKVDLQITSVAKRTSVMSALSGPSTGSVWSLGFDRDGTGISNHMIIQNHTDDCFRLHEFYVNWGRARVPPDAKLSAYSEDDCLFHAAGGWCATGSSGIVTYELDSQTFLHILWDCPYNFNHYCNFIGLYLCDEKKSRPDANLFNAMYQYDDDLSFVPERRTTFDLVCCGPGERAPNSNGAARWGVRRPCEVMDNNYRVMMTMGDGHKASSSVSIFKIKPTVIYINA